MKTDLIEERPGGPALVDTRVYVDDILVYLFDPGTTEAALAATLCLSPEQVAAARAYILDNPDTVFARRMEYEKRPAPENPPEFVERMRAVHESLMSYRAWRAAEEERGRREAEEGIGYPLSFREWQAERRSREARFQEWLAASDSRRAMFDEWLSASGSGPAVPDEWLAPEGSRMAIGS